jgi:UDP-N-acetylglucosamine 1-carboxyvinyltransferase
VIGPLLARFRKAFLPKPGGDKIGRRRLDTHFHGFEDLGARFVYNEKTDQYYVEAPDGLHGAYVLMDEISVTGTANILMTAVLAQGTTTIYNAACEPIYNILAFAICDGRKHQRPWLQFISYRRSHVIRKREASYPPDMIEIGSFIGLAAMTQPAYGLDCM